MFNTITIEAITEKGNLIRPVENVTLPPGRRALVTILDEEPHLDKQVCALLSEKTLAADWDRPEEDAAWSVLQ
jgi:predicted DNA-binding antitoxin AbrB/MazE fold protein